MGASPSACMRTCFVNSGHEQAEEVNCPADQPVGHRSSSSRATVLVPPVSDWLQVMKSQRAQQTETPRFEEALPSPRVPRDPAVMGSPRSVGGEFQTPRDTPRPGADESGGGKVEELSYEGALLDQKKHGTGVLRCSNATYEGQFEHDLKHGHGTLCWHDGRCYSGQFEGGKFHGSAVMTWPDGRIFDGQYIADRKHGEGTFAWSDGRRYEGQWVTGKRDGVGVYTNAKGLTRRGWWQNDRPVHWDPAEEPPAVQELRKPASIEPLIVLGPGGDGEAHLPRFTPLKEAALEAAPVPPLDTGSPLEPLPEGVEGDSPIEQEHQGPPPGDASELPAPPASSSAEAEDAPASKPEEEPEEEVPIIRPASLSSPRLAAPSPCSPQVPADALQCGA